MSEEERWKPIPEYEGIYEVSDLGRIRRVKQSKGARAGRILNPQFDKKTGYVKVRLFKENKGETKNIHGLVALAFIGTRPEGHEACHMDDNKLNNHLSNIEYHTQVWNLTSAHRNGLHPDHKPGKKLDWDAVHAIRASSEPTRTLKARYKVTKGTIQAIRSYRTWKEEIPIDIVSD
jgi:hypothetical protein